MQSLANTQAVFHQAIAPTYNILTINEKIHTYPSSIHIFNSPNKQTYNIQLTSSSQMQLPWSDATMHEVSWRFDHHLKGEGVQVRRGDVFCWKRWLLFWQMDGVVCFVLLVLIPYREYSISLLLLLFCCVSWSSSCVYSSASGLFNSIFGCCRLSLVFLGL